MVYAGTGRSSGLRATIDLLICFSIVELAVHIGSDSHASPARLFSFRITVCEALVAVMFVLVWKYSFSIFGLYRRGTLWAAKVVRATCGCFLLTAVLASILLVTHTVPRPGRTCELFFALSLSYEMLVLIGSSLLRRGLTARDPRRVLIIGSGRRASKAWRAMRIANHGGVTFLGFVDDRDESEMAPDVAARYRGRIDALPSLILSEVVDAIVLAMPAKSCYEQVQRAIVIAEQAGVSVVYLRDIFQTAYRRKEMIDDNLFEELVPLEHHHLLQQTIKRLIDIVGALVGLAIAAPVMLVIAATIKAADPGPVFFRQERFRYRRRRFQIIKFRSMVKDAPMLLSSLESKNEASGPIFKMRRDPRITAVGRVLRSTSLDELPQLWNVLTGDMSLVGPRPMSVRDVTLFDDATLMRRFSVKPGLTGLWQVSGRSSVSFEQWMAFDFHYIDSWSIALDLRILARTVSAVVKRSGAM